MTLTLLIRLLVAVSLGYTGSLYAAEVATGSEPDSSLAFWEWRDRGVQIRLVQRLPDQTSAFFQARGFTTETADVIAHACVFQAIFRNDGTAPLDFDLTQWRVVAANVASPLLVREDWAQRWRGAEINPAALTALNWSLLPTRQHFEPGDYNWGMASFGLSPGSRFDLSLKLRLDGETIEGEIPALICAPEE